MKIIKYTFENTVLPYEIPSDPELLLFMLHWSYVYYAA